MRPILAGLDTEYGLMIDGRGPHDQVEDAADFVRALPDATYDRWDGRHENPRADLRGFSLSRLATDPIDALFDAGRSPRPGEDVRADRVTHRGARFYNDHGHPEFATPERFTLAGLAEEDAQGDAVLRRAAAAFESRTGWRTRVYKNNTDFHGASYGSHENYGVPRSIGFERLFAAVTPMLVARAVLGGAGKVGAETGRACTYQLSQRADFLVEPANAETLYRRPVFNTRDEPHADPSQWIRLHVISGDANRNPRSTMRKVGLVKLVLALAEIDEAPTFRITDPVAAFQAISRDETFRFEVALEGRSWTTAYDIFESYFAAAEARLELDCEMVALIESCRSLLTAVRAGRWSELVPYVDWAAKRHLLEMFLEEEGADWRDPRLPALDLEYHNLDPEESLYDAMVEMGLIAPFSAGPEREDLPLSRGEVRGIAVERFGPNLEAVSWRRLVWRGGRETELRPEVLYPCTLRMASDVESFASLVENSTDGRR
jgi:proteasome accessory factor A